MMTMVTIEPRMSSSSISHSFAGEHIEDGGDEEADAERDHHEIKHGGSPSRAIQIAGSNHSAAVAKSLGSGKQCRLPHMSTVLGRAPHGAETEPGSTERIKCSVAH